MTQTPASNVSIAPTSPIYLDDLSVGDQFQSGEHAMDEAQITTFADQFDPQPFHLDDAAARETLFGGLAASGWHTAAVTMRLQVTSGLPIAGGIIGAAGGAILADSTRPRRECVRVRYDAYGNAYCTRYRRVY